MTTPHSRPARSGGAVAVADGGQDIARAAVVALYAELALYPKPGLVSFVDSGSHRDMDARTFMRSLFALRGYFVRIARLGATGAPFAALEAAGIDAEGRMLVSTGDVNTHRGAIFAMGLLVAAATGTRYSGERLSVDAVRRTLLARWSSDLAHRRDRRRAPAGRSHGLAVACRWRLRSAEDEAVDGYPIVFDRALPTLRAARARGIDARGTHLAALVEIMATLDDTNVVHRGGPDALAFVKASARRFIDDGGIDAPDVDRRLRAMHRAFVARRLSPGGAADLLAATVFVDRVTRSP